MTGLPQSSRARGVGIETSFRPANPGAVTFLPQSIGVVGTVNAASVGVADLTPTIYTTAAAVGQAYGLGSPLHLAALELFPVDGRPGVGSIPVTFFPYESTETSTDGSLVFSGSASGVQTYTVTISGTVYTVSLDGTIEEARNALLTELQTGVNEPFTFAANGTDTIDIVPKFTGALVNEIVLVAETTGYALAYTAPTSQGTNGFPSDLIDDIQFAKTRLNIMALVAETGASNDLRDFLIGLDGEWSPLRKEPKLAFFAERPTQGYLDELRSFRSGVFLTSGKQGVGATVSNPVAVISRAVREIGVLADNDPAFDYGGRPLTGIELPSQDSTFAERDLDLKAGLSTTELRDGVLRLSDTVTTYRPENDLDPAYRYVVDVIKLMNIIHNVNLIFTRDDWNGAPLVPDNQRVTNPNAKKPKMAVAELGTLTTTLADAAIVSDPETTRANTTAQVNSQNAKRLDVCYPPILSGNTNQISTDLKFSFFLGN